jgi:ribonuclease HII
MTGQIVCGIDEAGRGPVLGPLVLCGVCFAKSNLDFLSEIGVKDSKKLAPKRRKELAKLIKENCHSYHVLVVSAQEIDQREERRISMNRLEELKMAEIANKLKPDLLYLDAADVNEERFGVSIRKMLNYDIIEIVSKHRADDLFPIVSAASIIAKDKRDAIIEDLSQKYGNIGSGYPSDERTTSFLRNWIKKNKKAPPFCRKSWETTKKILEQEVGNKKITDYFR